LRHSERQKGQVALLCASGRPRQIFARTGTQRGSAIHMITRKMKEYLESLPKKPKHDLKYCVYMNRLQKRIDGELERLQWLIRKHPELYLDGQRNPKIRTKRINSISKLEKKLQKMRDSND
jgi:hypothetical protein